MKKQIEITAQTKDGSDVFTGTVEFFLNSYGEAANQLMSSELNGTTVEKAYLRHYMQDLFFAVKPEYVAEMVAKRKINVKKLNGNPIMVKLSDESAKKFEQTKKEFCAELENREAELGNLLWTVEPKELEYTFGCDTSDSCAVSFEINDLEDGLKYKMRRRMEEIILKHSGTSEIAAFRDKYELEQTESASFSYGSVIFTTESAGELWKLVSTRELEKINKKRDAEEKRLAEEKRITKLAKGREIIEVDCESAPHTQDLSGVILNSPAPSSGSFLVNYRVERNVWSKMKTQGAVYYDRDTLEDFDMFYHEPGWRYSIGAVAELVDAGFAVKIEREIFIEREALFGYYNK